jgi:ABC-type ATPase with predicted acetyltransferase domain
MLGLSVGKVILLVFLGLVVWMVLRYRARVRIIRQAFKEMQRQAEQAARGSAPEAAVNLHACTVCGAYVAADARPCGRPDCPQAQGGRRA